MAATQRSTVRASDPTDSRPLTRVLPSVLESMPLGVFVLRLADGHLEGRETVRTGLKAVQHGRGHEDGGWE